MAALNTARRVPTLLLALILAGLASNATASVSQPQKTLQPDSPATDSYVPPGRVRVTRAGQQDAPPVLVGRGGDAGQQTEQALLSSVATMANKIKDLTVIGTSAAGASAARTSQGVATEASFMHQAFPLVLRVSGLLAAAHLAVMVMYAGVTGRWAKAAFGAVSWAVVSYGLMLLFESDQQQGVGLFDLAQNFKLYAVNSPTALMAMLWVVILWFALIAKALRSSRRRFAMAGRTGLKRGSSRTDKRTPTVDDNPREIRRNREG